MMGKNIWYIHYGRGGGEIHFEMRKMSKCKKGGCEYFFRMRGMKMRNEEYEKMRNEEYGNSKE